MPTIHHHLGTDHYWKPGLCQVQTALPIVKNRALGKDLRCRVPHSAKNCTRQRVLCRVPGSWQKRGTRHRLPRVTVFGHVLLCRAPAVRHSAKIFFLENTLPSARDTTLGKDSIFFLKCPCRVPNSLGTRQREELKKLHLFLKHLCRVPKEEISKKNSKILFVERLILGTRQIPPLPSAMPRRSTKFFLFVASKFFVQPF